MQISFVNHAGFVCEAQGVKILCDPWLDGSAFNDGWDLVSETRLAPSDLEQVDYIWFSHEHPDHFSPSALTRIPEARRRSIVVLYKQTSDKKVIGFCRKLGFDCRELEDGRPIELVPGLELRCRRVPLHDSWLSIQTRDFTLLNLNDAVVHRPRALARLKRELGAIDVLFTQFNYAAWRGNSEHTALRRADAETKLDALRRQVNALAPRYTVPFASFSYFAHRENSFTNDAANEPSAALRVIERTRSMPVLMYPGDQWSLDTPHDNAKAEQRYREDYARLPSRPLRASPSVPIKTLERAAQGYIERIRSQNDPRMLALVRRLPGLGLMGPLEIDLWDHQRSVRFSFEAGLETLERRSVRYSLGMSSDSLHFLLKHSWGIDTLTVNARFSADPRGLKRLVLSFGIDALNNAGLRLSPAMLLEYETLGFLAAVLLRKLWSLRRQHSKGTT